MARHFLLPALALPLASVSAQQIWIVDRSGAGQFREIQAAVEVALPGDRIEVRGDHAYRGFELRKGIDIEALGASTVEWFLVRDVPATQRVRLTGLHMVGGMAAPTSGSVARTDNCQGALQLDRVWVDAPNDQDGLIVSRCATVLLRGCTMDGGDQTASPGSAGAGLLATSSGLAIEGTSVTGGRGCDGSGPELATPGGTALVSSGGSIVISQSALSGGAGGNGGNQGGIGGTGIYTAAAVLVLTGGSQVRGGPSGAPAHPGFPTGSAAFLNPFDPGRVRVGSDCTLVGGAQGAEPVAAMASLSGGADVAPGGRAEVTLSAQHQTVVVLLADVSLTHLAVPDLDGPLLLPPATALFVGWRVVPATGSLVIPFEIPNDPVLRGTDVLLQGVGIETARNPYFTDLDELRIR